MVAICLDSDFYEFLNLNIALTFLSFLLFLSQQKSLLCRLVATNFYMTNSPCLVVGMYIVIVAYILVHCTCHIGRYV